MWSNYCLQSSVFCFVNFHTAEKKLNSSHCVSDETTCEAIESFSLKLKVISQLNCHEDAFFRLFCVCSGHGKCWENGNAEFFIKKEMFFNYKRIFFVVFCKLALFSETLQKKFDISTGNFSPLIIMSFLLCLAHCEFVKKDKKNVKKAT